MRSMQLLVPVLLRSVSDRQTVQKPLQATVLARSAGPQEA